MFAWLVDFGFSDCSTLTFDFGVLAFGDGFCFWRGLAVLLRMVIVLGVLYFWRGLCSRAEFAAHARALRGACISIQDRGGARG